MRFLEARQAVACPVFLILSLTATPEARTADDGFVLRSLIPPGVQHVALRRAVMGALQRLARPQCQQLFSEFEDATGRSLQEKLNVLGQTPAGYLGWMLFADGTRLRRCQDPNVFAMTRPGSRVVFLCGHQFAIVAGNNPALSEAFLIHEELHSLGLSENPPSPGEITARVLAMCRP